MVLVHVCFIYNTAIFFTLTKSAKNHGQKLEHWQNRNKSNGKLALKYIVPFSDNDYGFQPVFHLQTFPPNK